MVFFCHVTLLIQSHHTYKTEFCNLTRFFFVFFSRGILLYDFIDDDDVLDDVIVDDASEEKVVISEQHWERYLFWVFFFV